MPGPVPPRRPIPWWRLVAGGFLHFAVIAYLVTVPLAVLLSAPAGATGDVLVRLALSDSGIFLAVLVVLGLGATLAAALLDRGRRGRDSSEADPTETSRHHLTAAAETARRMLDPAAAAQVEVLAVAAWHHDDHRFQALARDLHHVVDTAATAASSAPADRRPIILAQAAGALRRIGEELDVLNTEQARAEEAAALAATLYIENRYDRTDSAFRPE